MREGWKGIDAKAATGNPSSQPLRNKKYDGRSLIWERHCSINPTEEGRKMKEREEIRIQGRGEAMRVDSLPKVLRWGSRGRKRK